MNTQPSRQNGKGNLMNGEKWTKSDAGRGLGQAPANALSRQQFLRLLGLGAGVVAVPGLLGACGGQADSGNVTLSVLTQADYEEPLKPIVEAYKKREADVTLDLAYVTGRKASDALRARIGSGNAPDIFGVWFGEGSSLGM